MALDPKSTDVLAKGINSIRLMFAGTVIVRLTCVPVNYETCKLLSNRRRVLRLASRLANKIDMFNGKMKELSSHNLSLPSPFEVNCVPGTWSLGRRAYVYTRLILNFSIDESWMHDSTTELVSDERRNYV